MCLFYDNLLHSCQHAECQIVQTIRQLNRNNIFDSFQHQSSSENQPQRRPISLENLVDASHLQQTFKVEEEQAILEEELGPQARKIQEKYKVRMQNLEREVSELRNLVLWMKHQLEMQGLLQ